MACAGFTGFTRGCCGTCTLLGVFLHYMLVFLLLLLASISFLLYVDILFWVRRLMCVLFSVVFCLCVHVAPAGAPA